MIFLNYIFFYLLYLRNLQEQVKKAFCYQTLYWPFTVWTNCIIKNQFWPILHSLNLSLTLLVVILNTKQQHKMFSREDVHSFINTYLPIHTFVLYIKGRKWILNNEYSRYFSTQVNSTLVISISGWVSYVLNLQGVREWNKIYGNSQKN